MRKLFCKLVRDKIPDIIKVEGKDCDIATLSKEDYIEELFCKLTEEADELFEDRNIEELADVCEVISALMKVLNISDDDLKHAMQKKAEEKGRFEKQIF